MAPENARADQQGDVVGRTMAQNASKEIRELAVARRGVVGMLAGQVALEPRLVTGWHKEVVTVLAYTRMWREVADLNFEPGFATPGVAFDFTPNELDKAGLHASREALEGDLAETGVAWPQTTERPDWYEGESIYLRVERPARAPRSFQNNYAEFFWYPLSSRRLRFGSAASKARGVKRNINN